MDDFRIAMVGDTHIGVPGRYDASDLPVPEADLVVGMGDWVEIGQPAEYAQAVRWVETLAAPFTLVRGNHDNGPWHRFARQVCPPDVAAQLYAHGREEQMTAVLWKPLIWEAVDDCVLNLPKVTDWHKIPAAVQNHVIKLRDVRPGYYTLDVGAMLLVCLDTSDWLLGDAQLRWLEATLESAGKPVVLVGHHHFLPVGIQYDGAQVHERDALRRLVLANPCVTAYLHGHAHKDRWWRYGDTDIIAVRNRACRTVTFRDGRVVQSALDGARDSATPFTPAYLCAQSPAPGPFSHVTTPSFSNPWELAATPSLAWLAPEQGPVALHWSMRLPDGFDGPTHQLDFQVRTECECRLAVSAPGLPRRAEQTVPPAPEGRLVTMAIGRLGGGRMQAELTSREGWGMAAIAAPLSKQA